MSDDSISKTTLATVSLWALVWLLLVGAGSLALAGDHPGLAQWLGFCGCATSAAAATAQIRGYMNRLSDMVRSTATLQAEVRVRPLR